MLASSLITSRSLSALFLSFISRFSMVLSSFSVFMTFKSHFYSNLLVSFAPKLSPLLFPDVGFVSQSSEFYSVSHLCCFSIAFLSFFKAYLLFFSAVLLPYFVIFWFLFCTSADVFLASFSRTVLSVLLSIAVPSRYFWFSAMLISFFFSFALVFLTFL